MTQSAIDGLSSVWGREIRRGLAAAQPYAIATYYIIAPSEASSNLARYDGVHYGYRTDEAAMLARTGKQSGKQLEAAGDEAALDELDSPLVRMYRRTRAEGFGAEVKRRIMLGTYALSAGYYDAYYLKALKVRRLIRQDYDRAFRGGRFDRRSGHADAGVSVGEMVDDPLAMYLQDLYTVSANLAGIASISIPCGFTRGGPADRPATAGSTVRGRAAAAGGAQCTSEATDWHYAETRTVMSDRDLTKSIIGLEVHVQLATDTKLFCRCSTQFGAAPNTQTCPVCIGCPARCR